MVRNVAFVVQVVHDQVDTAGYQLLVNGTAMGAPLPLDPAGIQFPFPSGLPIGRYTIVVRALRAEGFDEGEAFVDSDPVELKCTPGMPVKPKIQIQVG